MENVELKDVSAREDVPIMSHEEKPQSIEDVNHEGGDVLEGPPSRKDRSIASLGCTPDARMMGTPKIPRRLLTTLTAPTTWHAKYVGSSRCPEITWNLRGSLVRYKAQPLYGAPQHT